MHTRTTPRIVPDTSTYVLVKLDRGEHHFRIPSAIAGAKLLKAVETNHIAALASFGDINPRGEPLALLAVLRNSGPELLGLAGYILGVAWHCEHNDLDTTITTDNPLVCGEAVLEELHEAGWSLSDMVLCALVVLREWMQRNTISAEVAARADFFGPRKGLTSSSNSTPESTSSEIPGGIAA